MKMNYNNFFKNGSIVLAGVLAFTFASCDNRDVDNRSPKRELEERAERTDMNEPSISYEEGEYQTTDDTNVSDYDYQRDYAYEERELVTDRVRNELDRTERSLERLDERMQAETENMDEQMKQEWEEARRELEQNRQDLSQRLGELEQATAENWEQVRNEANQSLREFEQEWEELKNKDIDIEVEDNTRTNTEYNN